MRSQPAPFHIWDCFQLNLLNFSSDVCPKLLSYVSWLWPYLYEKDYGRILQWTQSIIVKWFRVTTQVTCTSASSEMGQWDLKEGYFVSKRWRPTTHCKGPQCSFLSFWSHSMKTLRVASLFTRFHGLSVLLRYFRVNFFGDTLYLVLTYLLLAMSVTWKNVSSAMFPEPHWQPNEKRVTIGTSFPFHYYWPSLKFKLKSTCIRSTATLKWPIRQLVRGSPWVRVQSCRNLWLGLESWWKMHGVLVHWK